MRSNLYIFEEGEKLDCFVDGNYFRCKNEDLEQSVSNKNLLKANIFLGPSHIKNEIIRLGHIDKKYRKKFIEKEIHKRSIDIELVDYGYIDQEHILISRVSRDVVEYYLDRFPKLSSISSKMDFIIDYYKNEFHNDFAIVLFEEELVEIYKSNEEQEILYMNVSSYEEVELLKYEIEKTLIDSKRVIYFDGQKDRKISFGDGPFKESTLEELLKEYGKEVVS